MQPNKFWNDATVEVLVMLVATVGVFVSAWALRLYSLELTLLGLVVFSVVGFLLIRHSTH